MGRSSNIVILPVWQSRVLWNALVPCLFSADSRTASCLLTLILERQQQQAAATTTTTVEACSLRKAPTLQNGENPRAIVQEAYFDCSHLDEAKEACVSLMSNGDKETSMVSKQHCPTCITTMKRKLRVSLQTQTNKSTNNNSNGTLKHILLWIQPPTYPTIDFAFLGRVLAWEHTLLRTQSLVGYISTLGGGFFMCRHYQTAIWLAVEQERLAWLLHDPSMSYKCRINAAYNYIYAGKFAMARQLIQQVLYAVQERSSRPQPPSEYAVLVNMCHSARLFCRRVQKTWGKFSRQPQTLGLDLSTCRRPCDHHHQPASATKSSLTVDDFARIRVFRDQSRQDDLVIPFGHHHIVHKDEGVDVE